MSLNKDNPALRSSRRASGSLLSADRTPQSQGEDFFTDSLLDASKIPTPSPKKQPFHKAYKDRRAIGKSKILQSAWQSSARDPIPDNKESNLPANALRPTKLPSPRRNPPPLRGLDGTNTPPPPELSPTSPSGISSPAHGLDETYKRIAEEEDIAAQEGQLEDEDEYTNEMYRNGAYEESFHPDDESQTDGQNFEAEDAYDLGRGKENVPLEDGTAPTEVSGMSFLEGLTDQGLAAKLTPHAVQAAKDRALLEKAAQRQAPINFKGTKSGPTLSERLQRRSTPEVEDTPHEQRPQRPSSALESFREPSPNVPKSWTKQKPGRDWMQRSRQKREHGRDGAMSSPGQDSSQVDWAAAAADIALPSVEDQSTPRGTASSPASLYSQMSMDRIRQWELNDFTGQSLQVSDSPPVRPRANLVDQYQQREIERVEKQAVTTSRLGQYRKRGPNELIKILSRDRSTSAGPTLNAYPTPEQSTTPPPSNAPRPAGDGALSTLVQPSKAVKFAEEGEAIPDTPVVVFRSSSSASNGPSNVVTRPIQNRRASEDQLARLARAMSNSPKPSSTPEEQPLLEPADKSPDGTPEAATKQAMAHDTLIEKVVEEKRKEAENAGSTRHSSKQFAVSETTPKASKVVDTAKTPKVTGAWTDTILPDTVLRTIRRQEERPRDAQTPHFNAGGWIETPFPDGKRQSSALAPIPIEEEDEVPVPEGLMNGISKPREEHEKGDLLEGPKSPAPKSALTSLLARAKSRLTAVDGQAPAESNDTLHLNDSTINSLEDLLTLDNAELTTLIRMGAESEAREQLIQDMGAEPIAEAELLGRLGDKLSRLQTNIHDARKGISKLEHRVATSPDDMSHRYAGTACTACGSPSGYLVSINLPFAIPHLVHTKKAGQSLPRPTWLGWLTLTAWTWYLVEMAMCDNFAHPLYTDRSYRWPKENEPRFPFVLPTMLWRWSGARILPTLLGPLWWVLIALFRVIGQAVGWTDGFVDDVSSGVAGVGKVVEELGDAAGLGLGMDGDAYL